MKTESEIRKALEMYEWMEDRSTRTDLVIVCGIVVGTLQWILDACGERGNPLQANVDLWTPIFEQEKAAPNN